MQFTELLRRVDANVAAGVAGKTSTFGHFSDTSVDHHILFVVAMNHFYPLPHNPTKIIYLTRFTYLFTNGCCLSFYEFSTGSRQTKKHGYR